MERHERIALDIGVVVARRSKPISSLPRQSGYDRIDFEKRNFSFTPFSDNKVHHKIWNIVSVSQGGVGMSDCRVGSQFAR